MYLCVVYRQHRKVPTEVCPSSLQTLRKNKAPFLFRWLRLLRPLVQSRGWFAV